MSSRTARPVRALVDPDRLTPPWANRATVSKDGAMPPGYTLPTGKRGVILFDGVCNFCNAWVQFVVEHDPKGFFAFASMQSEVGRKLLGQCGRQSNDFSTVILIDHVGYHTESTAVLRVVQRLKPKVTDE